MIVNSLSSVEDADAGCLSDCAAPSDRQSLVEEDCFTYDCCARSSIGHLEPSHSTS